MYKLNLTYIILVSFLTFLLPAIGTIIEMWVNRETPLDFILLGKWFIFSAIGLRLFIAGIRQITRPGFTAKEIFQMKTGESYPVIRELGLANLCFGLIGIISLFLPSWRIVSAFGSGLYFGLAGIMHLTRKPADINGRFALVTDLIIFIILLAYVLMIF